VKADYEFRAVIVSLDVNRRCYVAKSPYGNHLITAYRHAIETLAEKILKQHARRGIQTYWVKRRVTSVNEKPQQACAKLTIKEVMLELVLITAQASVTRSITVVGTSFEYPKGVFKYNQA
jgi:hypothetical protein